MENNKKKHSSKHPRVGLDGGDKGLGNNTKTDVEQLRDDIAEFRTVLLTRLKDISQEIQEIKKDLVRVSIALEIFYKDVCDKLRTNVDKPTHEILGRQHWPVDLHDQALAIASSTRATHTTSFGQQNATPYQGHTFVHAPGTSPTLPPRPPPPGLS